MLYAGVKQAPKVGQTAASFSAPPSGMSVVPVPGGVAVVTNTTTWQAIKAARSLNVAWADAARYGQDPEHLTRAIDELYPRLQGRRGVYERTIAVHEARMIGSVRALGPRPLERSEFEEWRQRSREMVRSREGRSR